MNKKTIIRTFEKIALYMELLGENHLKCLHFEKLQTYLNLIHVVYLKWMIF